MLNLKRLGGWKSDQVATGYINSSLHAAKESAQILAPQGQSSFENPKLDNPIAINAERGAALVSGSEKDKLEEFDVIEKPAKARCLNDRVVFNITINQK